MITITPAKAVHEVANAIRALNALKPIAAKRTALIAKRVSIYGVVYAAYNSASRDHAAAAIKAIPYGSTEWKSRVVDRAFAEFQKTDWYKALTKAKRALTFASKTARATRQQIREAVAVLEDHLENIRYTQEQGALPIAEAALFASLSTQGHRVLTDLDDLEISVDQAIDTTVGLI